MYTRLCSHFLVITMLALFPMVLVSHAQHANTNSPLSVNVYTPSDWTPFLVWIDMFKFFRGWENHDDPNGIMPMDQVDENGWVKFVNPGQEVTVGHGGGNVGGYPGGNYLFTWEGEGTFSTRMASQFVEYDEVNKRAVIQVDNTGAWWGIRLDSTNPDNYARNMHCWLPGFWDETTFELKQEYVNDNWHPDFIQTIQRYETIRYMDWLGTNGSRAEEWSDIKPGTWWNQAGSDHNGFAHVSPAECFRLSNRVHANAWINIPHRASDAMVRRFAEEALAILDPDLKVYVEYGNEHWNWAAAFATAAQYCVDMNRQTGLPGDWGDGYQAYRSIQIWKIFNDVFGAQSNRVVKPLAWQVGNNFGLLFNVINSSQWNPDGIKPDFCAIAPYIHNNSIPLAGATAESFLQQVTDVLLPQVLNEIRNSKAGAQSQGIALAAYEANHHFFSETPQADAFYREALGNPAAKQMMLNYLEMVDQEMDGPIALYTSHGPTIWGIREYGNQPRAEAPLWDAVLTYIEQIAGPLAVSPKEAFIPSPLANRGTPVIISSFAKVFDLTGRLAPSNRPPLLAGQRLVFPGCNATAGMYLYRQPGVTSSRLLVR